MKYIKPTYKIVEIIMNDLCAASSCNTLDINVKQIEMKKQHKTYIFKEGETKGMWDKNF